MLEITNPASFILCCCDSSSTLPLLHTSITRSHRSPPPDSLCWSEAYLWWQSQHGWQWSIWWRNQVEVNALRLSRTDKDYILWWLRPEPDVISIPDVLHSVWSFSLWRLIHFCRHYLHSTTSITAEKYCQWHRRKEGSTMIPPPACCWRWTKCRTLTLNMKVHILHVFELDHKSTLASVKERSLLLLNVNEVNNEVFLLLQVTFYFSSIQLTPESLPQLKLWT